ncbi:MAG: flagellar hook-associated protein FlgK [Deltaproteobacteria bacterium]|nr:flagellar hook-associated protein FlgK [Deltaproteobacteria bacterium]
MSSNLFSQLDLGKRSLMAQQAGMNTAGHNIANVNNENFSRQRVDLDPQHPVRSQFGAGVDLKSVERLTDKFLTQRVVSEQSKGGGNDVTEKGLRRLEGLFAEMEGYGLRKGFDEFWAGWGRLANQPESEIYRKDLVNVANTLARRISGMGKDFRNVRLELNGRLSQQVGRAAQLAGQIAELNTRIQQSDRGHGEGNDLRDEREGALRELSTLVQIDWYEDENMMVNVTIGPGFPLVHGRIANKLEASFEGNESGMFSVRGIDPKGISRDLSREMRSGELDSLVKMRDDTMVGFIDHLDELAAEFAFQVNRLHNSGTGLLSSFQRLQSSFALKSDALNRPLPFLKDGIFELHMVNPQGDLLETYQVAVKSGVDTLASVVERINATVGDSNLLEARINKDGSTSLLATGPYNFVLGNDETDFTVVMGFNNFFETLNGADDFRINDQLLKDPNLVSTGKRMLPGDNSVALEISQLQFKPSMNGESITFDEFYNGMLAELGVRINRSKEETRNQSLIIDQFKRLRDEVSSVNMDEEVADMVKYQRGFEAAAKFVNTVDDMTKTVINM